MCISFLEANTIIKGQHGSMKFKNEAFERCENHALYGNKFKGMKHFAGCQSRPTKERQF